MTTARVLVFIDSMGAQPATLQAQYRLVMGITRSRPFRATLLLLSAIMVGLGAAGSALGQERHGLLAEVDGAINPVTQRFISRVIDKGEKDGAEVVIIKLDTPGGLLSSTQKITEDLLSDRVPTAVYVSPPGARAASAGTFITAAANFAVMAPSTSIGAAAPIGSGGEDLPDTLKSKVVEAIAADMRGIAQKRGRNPDALEDTIRKPLAYDAQQAVDLNVVDFIAQDVGDLLAQIDGVTVETASGPRTLNTAGLVLREIKMSLIERFLFFLADPNIAFLLLSLGGLGLVVELFNPGTIIPGVVGVILLLLAFVSLGNLPANWAAAGFILLAGVLLVAEIFVAGFGILGIGAIVSFILGGLLLFDSFGSPSPTEPSNEVSLWLLGSVTGALAILGAWFVRTASQSQRDKEVPEPPSPVIGTVGVATTDLYPRGTVMVEDEVWTAVTEDDIVIKTGEKVKVLKAEGPVLTVTWADEEAV